MANLSSTPNDPTFNGSTIFNSSDGNGHSFCAGNLDVDDYTLIYQPIHFNGEIGSYVLVHGQDDIPWMFKGNIYAPSLSALNTILATIEGIIDNNTGDESTYHALTDSYGTRWDDAQVRSLHKGTRMKYSEGWVAIGVVVSGICQSADTHEGATS